MVKLRGIVSLLACVVLLAACSSPSEPGGETQPAASPPGPTVDAGSGGGMHDHDAHMGGGGSKGSGNGKGSSGGGGGSGAEDGTGDEAGDSEDAPSTSDQSGSDGGGNDSAAAAYPAGGSYVYAQKGTEAFCDPAGNCDRHKLPPSQKIATTYAQRSETEAVVVTEVKTSNGRYVRTTMHFTPGAASVTEIYYRLVYEGLQLQEQYNPDPPVPQIRFPLRAGREWSASWKADTSGDYHARVTGMESVKAGGRTVEAYRIETLTNFRGELAGKASIVMWFDPVTKAVVRTNGALNLRASYGSYNTTFETALDSAPGY